MTYRFTLRDGSVLTGEYVGAQDGWLYFATGDEVSRIEQRYIVKYESEETP